LCGKNINSQRRRDAARVGGWAYEKVERRDSSARKEEKAMAQLFSAHNARLRSIRGSAMSTDLNNRLLSLLFMANVVATLLHYGDNILNLHEYPDLPTAQASSIVLFFIVMIPFGVVGYWLYVVRGHKLSYYLLYIYCLLNLVVLGHYLPSRLRGGFWDYDFKIHFLIWLEALTALALLAYVVKLHWWSSQVREMRAIRAMKTYFAHRRANSSHYSHRSSRSAHMFVL
jgi:hypothetical protein